MHSLRNLRRLMMSLLARRTPSSVLLRTIWLLIAVFGASLPLTCAAQAPSGDSAAAEQKPAAPAQVALADVASESEAALSAISNIEAAATANSNIDAIERELPVLRREVAARAKELKRLLASHSSIDSLRAQEASWTALRKPWLAWEQQLTDRAQELNALGSNLSRLQEIWGNTQAAAKADGTTPRPTLERIADVVNEAQRVSMVLGRTWTRILTLQDKVADQDAPIKASIELINRSRTEALNHLLKQDSPPIWSAAARQDTEVAAGDAGQESLRDQLTALSAYAERQSEKIGLHVGVFMLLLVVLVLIRRQVRVWVKEEPELAATTKVFDMPVSAALLLSLLLSVWFYPQAPRLLSAILGAIAVVPAVILLRHIIRPSLYSLLNALLAFYFVDQVRTVVAALAWPSRLLLLLEMLAGALFIVWLLAPGRIPPKDDVSQPRFWKVVKAGLCVALLVFCLSIAANLFGYVELAHALASTLLDSAYSALFFYSLLRIADGVVFSALRLYPFSRLAMVRNYRHLLRRRILVVLQLVAWFLWTMDVLDRLALRNAAITAFRQLWTTQYSLGSLHISVGDLTACAITIAAAFLVSRLMRFALDEEVFPHVPLPHGVPYALSRLLHYTILLVGFVVAIAAAGVDLTRFTILASAFGVGVGFGLQNIINNFVSGLILLFERPVQVGDAVQIADVAGVIDHIGIRASLIRLDSGAEVIVPNSNFITERVTNRALSSPQRTFTIRVGVAYGSDPHEVVSRLCAIAAAHEKVSKTPPPQVLFAEFSQEAVYFELQATSEAVDELAKTRSDLGIEIDRLFAEKILQAPNPGATAEQKLPGAART